MTPAQDAVVADEIVDLLARRLPSYVDAAWLREQVGSLSLGRVKIRQLRDYLVAHDDALTSGRSDGPTSRFTLLDALRERVPEEVLPALCVRGQRPKRLPYRAEGGRSRQNCQAKSARKVCVRCGQFGQPVRREAGGVVCAHCHNRDRSRWESCGACDKTARVITRRDDGWALCQSCAPRRRYTCAACGRHNQPAQAVTDEGPICGACYTRRRIRDCERCRRASPYVHRRCEGQLLCDRCWTPPPQKCSRCGQLRLIDHGHHSDLPVCFACTRASRPQVKCTRCHQYRSVHARLPIGPVCQECSEWSKRNPATCAACRRTAPLVAVDDDGNPICGACHGDPAGWTCHRCGNVDWINRERLCTRCVARDRNYALLAGPDGRVSQQLLPLLELIDSEEVLTTSRHSPSTSEWTRLLAQLTSTHDALTHETLDDLPQAARVHHLRHVLVHAGVLPPRDEEVDSTALWIKGVLADTDPEIARIVRQYALWSVLRRTRRRPRADESDRSVRKYARRRIVLALELLTWLQDGGQQLATMTQADLDRWVTGRSPGYLRIQDFLGWAQKQHLAGSLTVPSRSRSLPENYTDESEHWQMLRRCIHDTELPHDVRVAGSLILLFGQTPTRLVRLTLRDVRFVGDDARVTLGRRELALPSTFAALVRAQIAGNASRRLPLGQSADAGWIFPGSVPGQHADAGRLTLRLNQKLGLYIRPTRNRALCNLAAELPSPVLADLLGLHVNTANRWTRLVKSDWTAFVAERSRSYGVQAGSRQQPEQQQRRETVT